MDLIFPDSMLDIIILDLLAPTVVEVVDFASHLPAVLQIVSLVDLRIATFTKNTQDQVSVLQHRELCL